MRQGVRLSRVEGRLEDGPRPICPVVLQGRRPRSLGTAPPAAEEVVQVGDADARRHPLEAHVVELAPELVQELELQLAGGSEGGVASLGGMRAVAVDLLRQEGFAEPGAGSEHGDRAAGHRLALLHRVELVRVQERDRAGGRHQVVQQPHLFDTQ